MHTWYKSTERFPASAIPAYRIHVNQSTVDVLNSLKLGYKIQVRGLTELKVKQKTVQTLAQTLLWFLMNTNDNSFLGEGNWEHILVGREGGFHEASAYTSWSSRVTQHFPLHTHDCNSPDSTYKHKFLSLNNKYAQMVSCSVIKMNFLLQGKQSWNRSRGDSCR